MICLFGIHIGYIDVGIQNKGVEHVLPEAVTEDEFTLAQLFMTDEEKKSWENKLRKGRRCLPSDRYR